MNHSTGGESQESQEQEPATETAPDYPFPEGVKTQIQPEDVRWNMDWSKHKHAGSPQRVLDKPDVEPNFEPDMALAMLILNEVVFLNDHWWLKKWPEEARKTASLNVNCNDVFAWACADAEEMSYEEIEEVYGWWERNRVWGAAAWCCVKRRQMPQRPVEKSMRESGLDVDALRAEHKLRANYYDGVNRSQALYKYECYCEWERANGRQPLPFEVSSELNWWDHWGRYQAEHPKFYEEHKRGLEAAADQWRLQNGYEGHHDHSEESYGEL